MYAADCVVLPSYREGSPRSLMEAACLQKPLITTNVPGCRQVVEDNYNGLLCEVKDAEDLAVAMGRMMQFTDRERHQMGINGRKKMEKEFSDNIVIRKYFSAIDSIFFDELSLEWLKLTS
jgi:glycosyltransferase involved in cell wall biosynthesis